MISKKLLAACVLLFNSLGYSQDFNRDVTRLRHGTYVGYIAIDHQEAKIPAILEIVKGPHTWRKPKHKASFAVLKLLFGGFHSHEYLSQFYAIYHHKKLTFDASFDGNGPDTSLLQATISSDGAQIKSDVSTLLGGSASGEAYFRFLEPGTSAIETLKDVYPERYTIPAVSDKYYGRCDNKRKVLQLESRRNYSNTQDPHIPFYGYNVVSRVGRKPTRKLMELGREDIADYVFEQGSRHVSYNYYNQKISIPGIGSNCDFNQEGISCGEACAFKRTKLFNKLLVHQDFKPTEDSQQLLAATGPTERLFDTSKLKHRTGNYHGYMYFSNTSHYEKVIMEVGSSGTQDGREYLRLEGNVYIASGPITTASYIPFRFKPTTIDGDGKKPFLLISDEDQFIKVEKWSEEAFAGTWYSKSNGKIGTFNLTKKPDDIPPECTVEIPAELVGLYKSQKDLPWYSSSHKLVGIFQDSLQLSLLSDFDNIAPPYFPFILAGHLNRDFQAVLNGVRSITQQFFIEEGYYDPFTHAFYAELNNGKTLYGKIHSNQINGYLSGEARPGKNIGWERVEKFKKDEPIKENLQHSVAKPQNTQ